MAVRDSSNGRTRAGGPTRQIYRRSRDGMISLFRQRMVERLNVHKTRAADLATSVAAAFRETPVDADDQKQAAALQARAADTIDELSRFLRASDMEELVEKVEGIVRERPAVFFGSAFVLGFLLARYVTNSSQASSESSKGSYESGRLDDIERSGSKRSVVTPQEEVLSCR